MNARYIIATALAATATLGIGSAAYAASNTVEPASDPAWVEVAGADTEIEDPAWVDLDEQEAQAKAKISKDDAEKVALDLYPGGTATDSWIGLDEDGTPVWDFVVTTADGSEKWVTVNALDSKVIENEDFERPSADDVVTFEGC